jgi:uncharacterized alkaline shock family protein YloU
MEKASRPPGKTTVAPEVITTIARLNTLSVDGVSKMSVAPSNVNQFFKRGLNVVDGVRIAVEDNVVYADVYVVLKCDVNAKEVSHKIQARVARAISEMVGMEIGRVNVHIEDIDYSSKNVEPSPDEVAHQGTQYGLAGFV